MNSWEKNYPALKSLMTYNAEKNLIPLYVGEEISNSREVWEKTLPQYKLNQYNHPYPTPPQTSNGHVNHLEGEERNGFDTLVNVIHQQNGWRASIMWWFCRLKFCFQDWKYADKRHKWKEKVQKNAQFPFCGQTKAFRYEIVFRGIQPCFYTADRSAWLVLNQPRQRGFWRHLRYIPYSMIEGKYDFKTEFLYL